METVDGGIRSAGLIGVQCRGETQLRDVEIAFEKEGEGRTVTRGMMMTKGKEKERGSFELCKPAGEQKSCEKASALFA